MAARERDTRLARGQWGALKRAVRAACAAVGAHAEELLRRSYEEPAMNVLGEARAIPWEDLYEQKILEGWEESAWGALGRMTRAEIRRVRAGKQRAPDEQTASLQEEMALQWVDARGAALVRVLGQKARRAVNAVLGEAVAGGLSVQAAAKRLREVVGLSDRDALALAARRKRLERSGAKPERVDADAARYRERLIRRRADAIARTETVAAREGGRLHAWRVLQADGSLPRTARKKWTAGRDACPRCRALANQKAIPIAQSYQADGVSIPAPPAHPHCDCGQRLVLMA